MKKNVKIASAILCVSLSLFAGGCGKSEDESTTSAAVNKNYDICIYNTDRDNEEKFRAMCDEYTDRTGVIIKTITPDEEHDSVENLESYLSSDNSPDIFTVNDIQELEKWKSTGYIWDFSNATEENFKKVANSVPDYLRLSSNTADNFGIPCTTEAFGYIVDPKMIASLFGGDKYRTVIFDLQECSYDEFEDMIIALKSYITDNLINTFTLNGHEYSFTSDRGELSKNLNGAFAFAAGIPKNSGKYLANIPLSMVFDCAAAANIATETDVAKLESPFLAFARTLDLITLNVAGSKGSLGRGSELVSTSKNSTAQAFKNFVSGKALFLLASTENYKDLETFDSLVAKRCIFIPIKMPLDDIEIRRDDAVSNSINRNISIYCPRYYCINAKSTEIERKAAQEFLTWMNNSDLAAKYVVSEFGYVPYDTDDSSVIDSPLSRSMLEYISKNKVLSTVSLGAPEDWCEETLGKYLIEQLFTKASWNDNDYQKIADYAMKKWEELKDLSQE